MSPLKTFIAVLGLLLALPSAVAAAAALGGGLDWRLDVLSHAAPLYVVAGLAALAASVAAAGRLRLAIFALGAIAILAGGAQIAPELLRYAGPSAAATAPGQIKIIELNVWRQNRRLPEVVEWLAAQHPDVVVLEESSSQLRDMILARTGWRGVMGYASSTMIITPPPYLTMNRPPPDPASKLTFVNATYFSGSGRFEVVATHLDWPGKQQVRQRRALDAILSQLPRDRMILAGDFNSTPWSFARRQDDCAFGLLRRDRAMWSWPADISGPHGFRAPFPILPIDTSTPAQAGPPSAWRVGRGWALTTIR